MTALPWLIYVRVSTDDQAEAGVSLDAQEASCRSYAQARGWTVAQSIADPGYSGATSRRPGLQRLLVELREGRAAGVICWKIDRLTRSLRFLLELVDLADQHKVGLVSVTEAMDTSTPAGRLMISMLGAFGQHERETISARIKEAMQHVKRTGYWTGGHVPPGCMVVADGQRRKLVEDPAHAPAVRPLWSWILSGDGLNVCARRLQDAGVPAPGYVGKPSRRGWTPAMAWNLARSPQVTGLLVDAATQAAAVRTLATRQTPVRRGSAPKPGARASVASIVAGLARCPLCRSAMVQATVKNRHGREYRYFRCCLANKNRSLCRQKDARVEEVEAETVRAIEEAVNGGAYRETLLAARKVSVVQVQEARDAKIRLTSEREQLAGRIAHLAKTGAVGTDGFNLALAALGDEAKAIDRRLAEAEGILAVRGVDAHNIELILETIAGQVANLKAYSPEEKTAVLREWIERVEVHPDRVVLWMYQPDEPGNKSPRPFGRGFAPETGIGTPRRTACKPLMVVVPRGSVAGAPR